MQIVKITIECQPAYIDKVLGLAREYARCAAEQDTPNSDWHADRAGLYAADGTRLGTIRCKVNQEVSPDYFCD